MPLRALHTGDEQQFVLARQCAEDGISSYSRGPDALSRGLQQARLRGSHRDWCGCGELIAGGTGDPCNNSDPCNNNCDPSRTVAATIREQLPPRFPALTMAVGLLHWRDRILWSANSSVTNSVSMNS